MLEDGSSNPIHEARRRARDKLMVDTKKQVMKESRMMERTRSALMREIRAEAKELRLIDKIKKMRQEKDSRNEKVHRQNFGATDSELSDRCAAERMQEGRTKPKPKDRSVSSRLGRRGRQRRGPTRTS